MLVLSIPAGMLLVSLVAFSSMGVIAWLFPSAVPRPRGKKL